MDKFIEKRMQQLQKEILEEELRIAEAHAKRLLKQIDIIAMRKQIDQNMLDDCVEELDNDEEIYVVKLNKDGDIEIEEK